MLLGIKIVIASGWGRYENEKAMDTKELFRGNGNIFILIGRIVSCTHFSILI